ncbi:uncharacterized protein LOC108605317 [Drosophila busckii]|uniref:uncharacterized protein LOC108605317 n=1 Tax=Drosophila busckii TaxID=30019 RepID=UPI00083ED03C|nr:uncharacterized protein LOC108605317 [Drosophila busckii]
MNIIVGIVLFIFAAGTANGQDSVNSVAVILDLYNEKLNFFDLLSPSGLDELRRSTENITLETFEKLQYARISFTSLSGEILKWCTSLNNTVVVEDINLDSSTEDFILKYHVTDELKKMEAYYDTIKMNGIEPKAVEDLGVLITIKGDVLKMEITEGHITDHVEQLLFAYLPKLKEQGKIKEYIVTTTFAGEIGYAKRLINESLALIEAGTTYAYTRNDLIAKCKPILANVTAPQPMRTRLRSIVISKEDKLVLTNTKTSSVCQAVLSKSSVSQLKMYYQDEKYIANFFDKINGSGVQECKSQMTTFIRNSYLSWGYLIMTDSQLMKISILQSKPGSNPNVTIEN